MKTLLLLFAFIATAAHAELPTNPDKVWLDNSGRKLRGTPSASAEDREWMQDGQVRRKKQARDDREWMQDGRIRRQKDAREDREWTTDGMIKRAPVQQTAEIIEAPESAR